MARVQKAEIKISHIPLSLVLRAAVGFWRAFLTRTPLILKIDEVDVQIRSQKPEERDLA